MINKRVSGISLTFPRAGTVIQLVESVQYNVTPALVGSHVEPGGQVAGEVGIRGGDGEGEAKELLDLFKKPTTHNIHTM